MMTAQFSFTRAKAGKILGLAAKSDANEVYAAATCFAWLVPENDSDRQWYTIVYPMCIQGITLGKTSFMSRKNFISISAEGDVMYFDEEDIVERITGSGLYAPDAKRIGQMQDIQAIGGHLFACGNGGQIYSRDGERESRWRCLAPNILQSAAIPPREYMLLQRINGPYENDVYIVGSRGTLLHWNGNIMSRLETNVDAMLIDILVENENKIWICGRDATLLVGNYREGFVRCKGLRGTTLFQSMTIYRNELYLVASAGKPSGLFTYKNNRLLPVETGLDPAFRQPHVIDAAGDSLWVIGVKDVARFNGVSWQRFDFPGNDPIRSAGAMPTKK